MTGDTLMARITPCLENGKTARYQADPGEAAGHGSTEFIVVRGRPEVTDSDFAYYLTRWDRLREYAISQMSGSSGRQRVSIESLDHFSVPVPPLPEQRAIAHVLGILDDKIELNRRMNETLEAMARAIFQSWFVDFDPVRAKAEGRDTGLPKHLADLFPDAFEDSELGEIPAGWEVRGLDEIANYLNGLALQKYPPTDGRTLPVIKIAQLKKGTTDGADRCSADVPEPFVVKDGNVLFSWSGSLAITIWCGGDGALNQHLFKITSPDTPKWFYYLWTSHHLPNFQAIAAGKATTMGHIQRHHLSDAKTLVPSKALMDAMDAALSPVLDRVILSGVQNQTLAALRDALLPKLISGEIRVKPAPEDAITE
jgi:type I restriction enzyme S subunit